MTIQEQLQAKNRDTSKIDGKINASKLFSAIESRNLDKIRCLVNNGVDINTKGEYGETALIHATDNADKKIVRRLIELGADINSQDDEGWTALIHAIFIKSIEIAKLLIKSGADVNIKDNNGQTPLMIAADFNAKETGELLILEGADIDAVDNQGMTAFDIAHKKWGFQISDYFLNTRPIYNEIDRKRMEYIFDNCISMNNIGDTFPMPSFKKIFKDKYGYALDQNDFNFFLENLNKKNGNKVLRIINNAILQLFPSYNEFEKFLLSLFSEKNRIKIQTIKDLFNQKYNCEIEEKDCFSVFIVFNMKNNNKIIKKEGSHFVCYEGYSNCDLNKMGASWFVSYAYYIYIDNSHVNWNKISTISLRKSVYNNNSFLTRVFWLKEIVNMDNYKLETNWIDLSASEIKKMANELLVKMLAN